MKYRVLAERLAVCQLASDATAPSWAEGRGLFCMTRTSTELSVVCEDHLAPEGARIERGWIALKLEGPFPFSMTGVLASFLDPLASAAIPIFAISTFDTDYVLIKSETVQRARTALGSAGHEELE